MFACTRGVMTWTGWGNQENSKILDRETYIDPEPSGGAGGLTLGNKTIQERGKKEIHLTSK